MHSRQRHAVICLIIDLSRDRQGFMADRQQKTSPDHIMAKQEHIIGMNLGTICHPYVSHTQDTHDNQ